MIAPLCLYVVCHRIYGSIDGSWVDRLSSTNTTFVPMQRHPPNAAGREGRQHLDGLVVCLPFELDLFRSIGDRFDLIIDWGIYICVHAWPGPSLHLQGRDADDGVAAAPRSGHDEDRDAVMDAAQGAFGRW